MKISYREAVEYAIEAGASAAEIEREARAQDRQRGSVPHKNMKVALQLMPYLNGRAEWVRLAGALQPKGRAA